MTPPLSDFTPPLLPEEPPYRRERPIRAALVFVAVFLLVIVSLFCLETFAPKAPMLRWIGLRVSDSLVPLRQFAMSPALRLALFLALWVGTSVLFGRLARRLRFWLLVPAALVTIAGVGLFAYFAVKIVKLGAALVH